MKKNFIYILIGIIVALVAYLLIIGWLNNRPNIRFGENRSAIIVQTQLLNRFETASYTIDKVIEAETPYNTVRQFFFGDKIVLIAHGTVIAGFDLSKLKPQDFSGYGTDITIHLPDPEIFSVIIDNEKTKVFDRDQGVFTKGQINLEAQARQEAEASIKQAACEGNILQVATENAKKQLEILFKGAGFKNITINAQDISAACTK